MHPAAQIIAAFMLGIAAIVWADKSHAHEGDYDHWCLMAKGKTEIVWDCIRTFDSEGWCIFDLKTMVNEQALVPVDFKCYRPIMIPITVQGVYPKGVILHLQKVINR